MWMAGFVVFQLGLTAAHFNVGTTLVLRPIVVRRVFIDGYGVLEFKHEIENRVEGDRSTIILSFFADDAQRQKPSNALKCAVQSILVVLFG
jgi:hypothetical protein